MPTTLFEKLKMIGMNKFEFKGGFFLSIKLKNAINFVWKFE